MTTLPRTQAQWETLIENSIASFASLPQTPGGEATYLLVMEETDGQVTGTSAIYSPLGFSRPFYSYKITRTTHCSPEHELRFDADILVPMNDYNGAAEIGTLLLRREYRGGGRGRLLALARYMLIGAFMDAFPEIIMAEMRGWRDPQTDTAPFWDAVGKHFFKMPFDDADQLSGNEYRFIADMLPRVPLYAVLLPEAAQAAIGKPHKDAELAFHMLMKQGFRFNRNVDIFDAGPCLEVHKHDIDVVRNSRQGRLGASMDRKPAVPPVAILAHTSPGRFVVGYAYGSCTEPQGSKQFSTATELDEGAQITVYPLEKEWV